MNWIDRYSTFLFDFDGLLVNTEELHFRAYKAVAPKFGIELTWDFPTFCEYSHYSSGGVRSALGVADWEGLYRAKSAAYLELISTGAATLMPGVEALLTALSKTGKRCAVITNSPRKQIETICSYLSILSTIPNWFTREDYSKPKPDPDGYLTALRALGDPEGDIIGFEDSYKGMKALLQTPAHPVVISTIFSPKEGGVFHFPSFEEIPSNWTP